MIKKYKIITKFIKDISSETGDLETYLFVKDRISKYKLGITIVKIDDDVKDKKELEKILLCDAQVEISPYIERTFLNVLHDSGYPGFEFEKKLDFEDLYSKRTN